MHLTEIAEFVAVSMQQSITYQYMGKKNGNALPQVREISTFYSILSSGTLKEAWVAKLI